jgi:nucleotide-binding universal stress UspA family protein
MNLKSILFSTDLSECSDGALQYASALAAQSDATLYIVFVQDWLELATLDKPLYLHASACKEKEDAARLSLSKIVPTLPAVKYERHYLTGEAVADLIAFANKNKVDLIVMGSHGRTGLRRLLMGSVAEGVMRKARCPLLLVRSDAKPDHETRRILCLTDFSECSNTALALASQLASAASARLYILHVDGILDISPSSDPPDSDNTPYDAPWGHSRRGVRERLLSLKPTVANVAYENHYLTGPPVSHILKFAECEHIDLIVVGSHGRCGLSRLLMGSVAEGVMRHSKCPVLVAKGRTPVLEDVQSVSSARSSD